MGSTVGQELYISEYSLHGFDLVFVPLVRQLLPALLLSLPVQAGIRYSGLPGLSFAPAERTSWPVFILTVLCFAFIDMVTIPWRFAATGGFSARSITIPIGVHLRHAMANYVGWAVVGSISLCSTFPSTDDLPIRSPPHTPSAAHRLLSWEPASIMAC